MWTVLQLHILILLLGTKWVFSAIFKLDTENYVDKYFMRRDGASGGKTVKFNKGQSLNLYFCLRRETPVALHSVVYSNDGGSDTFDVSIDGIPLGKIITPPRSDNGTYWNKFLSSEQLGPTLNLPSGRHRVTLNFTEADVYGVEVDQIQIRAEDPKLQMELFNCALYCDESIRYNNGAARDDMASAQVVRKILSKQCSSEDNILVPIYHEDIKFYRISAFMPQYKSFENNFAVNDEACSSANQQSVIWRFDDVSIPIAGKDDDEFSNGAKITYFGSNTTRSMKFTIVFSTTFSEGDFDKGTVLKLAFRESYGQMYIQMIYRNKNSDWSERTGLYINSQQMGATFSIPPQAWLKDDGNEIEILILGKPDITEVIFDHIELARRLNMIQDENNVYESKDIQMNSADIFTGDTLKDSEKMSIRRLDNGTTIKSSSYLSIFYYTPWSQRYSEVFRLYQNGRLQLLPMVPKGLNTIPFGTAVVIGQSDPDSKSPKAPIEHIDVDPAALQIYIHYKDKSTASILVRPSLQETRVIVKDVVMTQDQIVHPFATISTMWQTDGNSEADHVSSNGNVEHHIINGWESLFGTSFTFFRKCISRHNTQSPDIQVTLISENDVLLHV